MTTLTRTLQLLVRPPEPGEYQITEEQGLYGPLLLLSKQTCSGVFEIGPFRNLARIIDYVQEEERRNNRMQALEEEMREYNAIPDMQDLTHHITKKIDLSMGF